jgi:hypothetical protein
MTIPHITAWKIGTWMCGSVVALAAASIVEAQQGMNPMVEVALIMSGSSLLVAIVTGGVSIYMQRQTGRKVDGLAMVREDKITQQGNQLIAAEKELSHSEGRREGSESERAKESK